MHTITVTGRYLAYEIQPPAHSPRQVAHPSSTVVQLPELSSRQAPAVFRVDMPALEFPLTVTVREHDGHLYMSSGAPLEWADLAWIPPLQHQAPPTEVTHHDVEIPRDATPSRAALLDTDTLYAQAVQEYADRFVVIDGAMYQECGEPAYYVTDTGILVSLDPARPGDAEAYYRADELEQAVSDYAHRTRHILDSAVTKRDMEQYRYIHVLDPDAVTLICPGHPTEQVQQLREDFAVVYKRYMQIAPAVAGVNKDSSAHPEYEEDLFQDLIGVRRLILDAGATVLPSNASPTEPRRTMAAYLRCVREEAAA